MAMNLELKIRVPEGMTVESNFDAKLSEILRRAQVPFEINSGVITLTDATDAESRYVIRVLQRQGYTVVVRETSE